jgi:hypothetical protein
MRIFAFGIQFDHKRNFLLILTQIQSDALNKGMWGKDEGEQ